MEESLNKEKEEVKQFSVVNRDKLENNAQSSIVKEKKNRRVINFQKK